MVKILSQAGNSLADIYDVEGSIAGIEHLETHDLPIVHEMGSTVFSERFTTTITRIPTAALLQNVDIDVVSTNFPQVPSRVLSVSVLTDQPTRILRLAVLSRDPVALEEIPLWVFDTTPLSESIRIADGGAPANSNVLIGRPGFEQKSFTGGFGQPDFVGEVALRGRTTGFGAGNVTIVALVHFGFGEIVGISSRGLPIPSW